MNKDKFVNRHNGPSAKEAEKMLHKIGLASVDELIGQTVPDSIRLKKPLKTGVGLSEFRYLKNLKKIASKNKVYRSYIGMGYYGTIVPSVIQRNILENPGWYTAYTPYQGEISQGRLEALLNFQTMVIDLCALPIANASLLDEATAGAEAMILLYSSRSREIQKRDANVFFVSQDVYPQTLDVLKTRALPLGIKIETGDWKTFRFSDKVYGVMLQYPAMDGRVQDYSDFVKRARTAGVTVAVASDLLALTLLAPPGEWGADVVFGNSQRLGVPMGYGGPHAGFFACKEEYKRLLPGRIIGVSVDAEGHPALRMALQTREQHIRRDKATSNICTAQALLAIMAGMYGVYHGPEGLKGIAEQVHRSAFLLAEELRKAGCSIGDELFFDTIKVQVPKGIALSQIRTIALKKEINFHYSSEDTVSIALDQCAGLEELNGIISVFAEALGCNAGKITEEQIDSCISPLLASFASRYSSFMTHPVFNSWHSETELMRYIKRLENKDLSLTHSMIPLGSCTMKLNAASELYPVTWPEFANMHPFAPAEQARGYQQIFKELEKDLSGITGFAAMSFQPNSGAQGEYAGLMVIRAYHQSRGQGHRNIALIPSSAHGTNPASAAMAGMQIVVVKCDDHGNIEVKDLQEKAIAHKDRLSCLMVTYPSTHGVFEESIRKITKIIHENGGQVYMDGANMNAQVGLTSPGNIGADVCHLNLHKTFAIPHGGGGPGVGPIGVAKHLAPFLPSHALVKTGGAQGISAVSAAPWGSALILLVSYGYIKMLGAEGLTEATKTAILNANYMKEVLKDHYPVLYSGKNGRVAHEMILNCVDFKRTAGVEVGDIAKRLMDYGFHAPTVGFPVHDTLMIEPTESESMAELDRFCEAMISIRLEIQEIADGRYDAMDNVIKNAPHTVKAATASEWSHTYSREKAVFPLKWVQENKFWPSVARIDNALGDRNLICACPPVEQYFDIQEESINFVSENKI
jgi:glycine dehydrogenase